MYTFSSKASSKLTLFIYWIAVSILNCSKLNWTNLFLQENFGHFLLKGHPLLIYCYLRMKPKTISLVLDSSVRSKQFLQEAEYWFSGTIEGNCRVETRATTNHVDSLELGSYLVGSIQSVTRTELNWSHKRPDRPIWKKWNWPHNRLDRSYQK
jgi:hypothetical protein